MWEYNYDCEMLHSGVKGMKWGVRRYQNKDGSLTPLGKKRTGKKVDIHDDYKKAHNRKSVKSMSDAELRSRLNRLDMEKRYSQMNPSTVNKGKNYVNTAIKTATTIAAVTTTALTLYNNANKIKQIIGH